MEHKFSWGIMGGGFISGQFAAALETMEDAEAGAVAFRSGKDCPIAAKRYYNSYEQLAKDPEIDAVYIGTIHPMHFENAELCLKMGKPVLCEKPVTMNRKELIKLTELAEERETFFMEAVWTRFIPACSYIKEKIASGAFGKIRHMQISFGEKAGKEKERLFQARLGGGALLDIGVYGVNFAQWLLDEAPDYVGGWARKNEEGIDLTTFAQMQYPSGADVEITSSIEKKLSNTAYIITDKGEYVIPYFWRPDTLYCYELNGGFRTERLREKKVFPIRGNGYQYEAAAVQEAIVGKKKESAVMPWKDSLAVMQLLDDIRRKCGIVYPQDF